MRILLITAAAVVMTACTPRDDLASDRSLTQSPEAAVYGEPTVTGGAYDSIIHRVARERGLPAPGAHGAPAAHGGAGGDSVGHEAVVGDSAAADSAVQPTGGGPAH